MIYLIGLGVIVALAAGLYLKKDETVAFLKSGWTWLAATAGAVTAYFTDIDITSWF